MKIDLCTQHVTRSNFEFGSCFECYDDFTFNEYLMRKFTLYLL